MEEIELFNERGLCLRYNDELKEFKERGRGEIKILRHPDTGYSRVVIVRDQILKLGCNHFILSTIKIQKKEINGIDRFVQYSVSKDYAL